MENVPMNFKKEASAVESVKVDFHLSFKPKTMFSRKIMTKIHPQSNKTGLFKHKGERVQPFNGPFLSVATDSQCIGDRKHGSKLVIFPLPKWQQIVSGTQSQVSRAAATKP